MAVTISGSGQIVKQVVQGTLGGSVVSTTSTSLVSTGLTATITPTSSTSKILVLVNLTNCYSGVNLPFTVYRNGTNIAPTGSGIYQSLALLWTQSGNIQANQNISYLDSPATSSAVTYTVYWAVSSGTGYFNNSSQTSTIQLLEISGS